MRTRSASRLAAAGAGQTSYPDKRHDVRKDITRDIVSTARRRKTVAPVESLIIDSLSDDPDYTLPAPRLRSRSRSPTKRSTMRIITSAPKNGERQGDSLPIASSKRYHHKQNPNPEMYEKRQGIFDEEKEREARLGIVESPWFPLRSQSLAIDPFEPRSLRDLDGYTPTRLGFKLAHPKNDWGDQWFEELVRSLFTRVEDFARSRFGLTLRIPWSYQQSPWTEDFSEHFINLVSEIARKDDLVGGWDVSLFDSSERAYVVMGVIGKVLEENVFSELVFGDTPENKQLWQTLDNSYIGEEGYCRKRIRSSQMRLKMSDDILTPNFWKDVDRLTSQTTALLLPLINLQGKLAPESNWPRLVVIHQELHNIIAHAGYLAICMSWSNSVFRISFPDPGQTWETDQNHFDGTIYKSSQKAATAHDLAKQKAASKKPAQPPSRLKKMALALVPKRHLAAINRRKEKEKEKAEKPQFRVAKVKIALWPLVQRFQPLSPAEGYGSLGGEKITTIMKSQVVFYAGLMDGRSEMAERGPLAEHVKRARWQASSLHPRALLRSFVRLLALLVLVFGICLLLHFTDQARPFDLDSYRDTYSYIVQVAVGFFQRKVVMVTKHVQSVIPKLLSPEETVVVTTTAKSRWF